MENGGDQHHDRDPIDDLRSKRYFWWSRLRRKGKAMAKCYDNARAGTRRCKFCGKYTEKKERACANPDCKKPFPKPGSGGTTTEDIARGPDG